MKKAKILSLIFCVSVLVHADPSTVRDGFYNNEDGSPLIPLVDSAEKTIDIEIYEMNDKSFHEALRRALRRHVRIRVVKDSNPGGESCSPFKPVAETDKESCKDYKKLAEEIRNAGGVFTEFNKAELCGVQGQQCFEHGKMVIADGMRALLSTGNFNASNLCDLEANPAKCNRDFSFIVARRHVVRKLSSIFEKDIIGKRYYPIWKPLDLFVERKLTVSPFSEAPLIEFIQKAKHSIDIENQYLKEKPFNEALFKIAKEKHVTVRVTLASDCSFGKPKEKDRKNLTKLHAQFDDAGIKLRMFTDKILVKGKPGYMHAKAIVVDGEKAWVGSVNGSDTAMNKNREYGYFFNGKDDVTRLLQIMRADHENPNSESWMDSLNCVKEGSVRPEQSEDQGE